MMPPDFPPSRWTESRCGKLLQDYATVSTARKEARNGASEVLDLEMALGQYTLYRDLLAEKGPDRSLYLAIPVRAFGGIFSEPLGQMITRRQQLRLFVFDEAVGRIIQWLP